jgi:glycosidase
VEDYLDRRKPLGQVSGETWRARIRSRLRSLYGQESVDWERRIFECVEQHQFSSSARNCLWDERDIVLITYPDQISESGSPPLKSLSDFLVGHRLDELIRMIHVLPFFPSSSDDGFSVMDYSEVEPKFGGWEDIRRLGSRFDLMVDLVINHASSQSKWFKKCLEGQTPYDHYFLAADPSLDWSKVVRPRALPFLTPFETATGKRFFWTTFSPDQIDLNFANPQVLLEFIETLLLYIRQGARVIRLDAIAYLWKQSDTPCIHLPQTHEVVKLLRDLVGYLAPHVLLITETNVPHQENVSYFGQGDESHLVYQFSLPPLLMDAMLCGDAGALNAWLASLEFPALGCNYLNFTASHDGIGVRPLEGLIPDDRFAAMLERIEALGGLVSKRRQSDGSEVPYELNISYLSAMGDANGMERGMELDLQVRRFMTTQGLMLAMRGIPAVYFHSLVGSTNDSEGARLSGIPRRINRRKFRRDELENQIQDGDSLSGKVFAEYCRLLSIRVRQPAFHPDADQEILDTGHPWLVAFRRRSLEDRQRLLVMANVSRQPGRVALPGIAGSASQRELLSNRIFEGRATIDLAPGEMVWLESHG